MSEAVETAVSSKTKKETVYTEVKMADGRAVSFPGTQQVKKSVLMDANPGHAIGVQFDFRNGETRVTYLSELADGISAYAACHGLLQKIGDEWSGTKDVDDVVLTHDEVVTRLRAGDWFAQRTAGDSMAGASVVIRALMEASNKSRGEVQAYLQNYLDAAKGRGETLTRQALYASFRNPTSAVGKIIRRLEDEAASKTAVNADSALAGLMGA